MTVYRVEYGLNESIEFKTLEELGIFTTGLIVKGIGYSAKKINRGVEL